MKIAFAPTITGLALLLFASCAQQPLSSIDRNKYKSVALDPELKVPDHYIYRDITGKRWRGFSGGFGLSGALIGLVAGASSEGPGFHRFDAAARKSPVDIRAVVRKHTESALRSSQLLKVIPGNPDLTLKIKVEGYGVGPVNGRELGAVIVAHATLTGRDGKEIWNKDEWANSDTTALLEGIEANPTLWPKMTNEAGEALAKKLILVTTKTGKTAAEPFM